MRLFDIIMLLHTIWSSVPRFSSSFRSTFMVGAFSTGNKVVNRQSVVRGCPSPLLERSYICRSFRSSSVFSRSRIAMANSDNNDDVDYFFSSEHPDFLSLLSKSDDDRLSSSSLNTLLSNRLEKECKLTRPSAVQSATYEAILSGEDTTIGAETGSGKTYAYLLPLVQSVLNQKQQMKGLSYEYCRAVILVPNKELAQQVVRMAASLCGGINQCVLWGGNTNNNRDAESTSPPPEEIVHLAILPGGLAAPVDFKPFRDMLDGSGPPVDLLIATPAALGPWAHTPKNIDFFADVQTLIVDEADMLLDGGYLRPLQNVLMGFRRADRLAARYHNMENENDDTDSTPKRTQHVFVGATLPDAGLKSVDAYLQKKFPYSKRILMPSMHNANHYGHSQRTIWIPDDPDEPSPNKARLQKLVQMLEADGDLSKDKVMVFLNTVQDVDGATNALLRAGIDAVPYHAKIKLQDRIDNLQRFRDEANDVVLVCTDLAARGLDVPSVTAVVQLQFATNVVTHLHRMGRCGRAGSRNGKAIIFHSTIEQEVEVVKVVQSAEKNRIITLEGNDVLDDESEESPTAAPGKINSAFSRKRGFTKKRKKLQRKARERS